MANSEPLRLNELLRAALAKEEQARDSYRDLAKHCSTEFVRELLARLADEEAKHVKLIQALIAKMQS